MDRGQGDNPSKKPQALTTKETQHCPFFPKTFYFILSNHSIPCTVLGLDDGMNGPQSPAHKGFRPNPNIYLMKCTTRGYRERTNSTPLAEVPLAEVGENS
jgi:hypothetical protein